MQLTAEVAAGLARIALGHVTREYPHKLDHVLDSAADARAPRDLHPIFFGSFDWHSCVHSYWLLLTVRRLFPELPESAAITALVDAMLTPAAIEAERAYLDRPSARVFERPYGWAWLLALHAEAARHPDRRWDNSLAPLAEAFAARFRAYLPKQTYPIRVGTHFNTAFAFELALGWAETNDAKLAALICERARAYFGRDRDCQAWEPCADEFLSPALMEALLMRRVLGPACFEGWLSIFLPQLGRGEPATLFEPAIVSDRSDGKLVHLDGLNLSRAWCWKGIAPALGTGIGTDAAARHLEAGLAHVSGDFMGEHWLATFALLALCA
jgi:hypothetical protein